MMLFDTHAHYDDEQFDLDRDDLLSSMEENGVGLIFNPGCDIKTSEFAIKLADKYKFIYAGVACHPEHSKDINDEDFLKIEKMIKHPKVKAIGEIGLDYYWDTSYKDKQKEVFIKQMQMAEKYNLPVIIHDREAHEDCLEIVKQFPRVIGVYHCYSGSAEMAKVLIKLGYYISFTGVITFKNARKSLEVIEQIPLDRIMIETDSPYLSPVPNRGKRNSSLNVKYIAEKIAEVRNLSVDEVITITTENGKRFYNI